MAETLYRQESMSPAGLDRQNANRPSVAKWGAACSACANAKAKCIRSSAVLGSKCDRCERLFKDCAGQSHRPRKKRQPKPSRTAQLEEKLNGLVNILKASGDLSKANLTTEQLGIQLHAATAPATTAKGRPAGGRSSSERPSNNPWAIPDTYNSCAPVSCICRPEGSDAPPPPDSDEALLNIYRNELQINHPFVIIPPTMSAATLVSERPFLMASVRMVSSFRSLRSMRSQMYHLMKTISERMLVQSERSMDLLLGLIVVMGWYQYHCPIHAQLSNLVGLATALAGELGLGRIPIKKKQSSEEFGVRFSEIGERTNEERRALAGVWFLSSTFSLGYGKVDSMRATRYLDQCLKELEANMEYDSDAQLVTLVRIQHLMERLSRLNDDGEPTEEIFAIPTLPTLREVVLSACQVELERIKENMPAGLKSNRIIQTYINTATLRLYEPPIVTRELVSLIAQSLNTPDASASSPLYDIYQSHAALTAWFDNWLSIPVSTYYSQTSATCIQTVYAISRLGRWARLVTVQGLQRSESVDREDEQINDGLLDPSLGNTAPSGSSPSLSSAPTPSGSEASVDRELCPYNPNRPDESNDPTLPVAVASVQGQLGQFPGLEIDIPQIMSTLQKRFQDVSTSIQCQSVPAEQKDLNAWSMNAIKMFLTRAKLEHWAELVAEGVEALSMSDRPRGGGRTGVAAAAATGQGGGKMMATEDSVMSDLSKSLLQEGFLQDGMNVPYFYGGNGQNPWVADMVQNGDASTWFDGYLNWGAADDGGMMR